MTIKVRMVPHESDLADAAPSGIQKVVEKYFQYLPDYDVELVKPTATSYDLLALHAGTYDSFLPNDPIVSHCHGLYWTDDQEGEKWEHVGNHRVIDIVRHAKLVTVPSPWVAESFQRDMHLTPTVIPHGVDFEEWRGAEDQGYVLWNKNRPSDVCDPTPVTELALRLPSTRFISTYATKPYPRNIRVMGTVDHGTMRELVKGAALYLATTKETFGIGTLEALAAGVPVLGFDWGGTADLITHGRNGYLAAPGDYEDLAVGAEWLMKHRRRISRQARDSALFYSWGNAARLLARAYADTLIKLQRKARVAVIIPCYNKAETVVRAINSVLMQTQLPFMLIIVDNNSTDNSREVIERHVDTLNTLIHIHIVNCEEQGVAHARNFGIEHVNCDYICCLDADDEIAPTFLEVCTRALDADNSLAIAYTGLLAVKEDGSDFKSQWPNNFDYEQFIVGKNQVPTCCLFRRDFWERAGGYRQRFAPDGAGAEDAELWLRIGALGGDGKQATKEPLFIYHLGGAVSGNKTYSEPNWRAGKPWIEDGRHPFASIAKPANKEAHLVRQYDQPLVSVVIPCGPGHLRYLTDCLDSVEAQSCRQWEVVLVADVKEDEYWQIHELVTTAYPFVRLTWPARPPVGAGAARNYGVEHARAPLILFLDADDWLTPNSLNILLDGYREHPMTIIYGQYIGHAYIEAKAELDSLRSRHRLLDYNEKTTEASVLYYGHDFDCERALRQPDARQPYIWNVVTSLVPRIFHREIGGFDPKMESWEDWDYWLRMARKGKCFSQVHEPVMEYRFYTGGRRAMANPTESGDEGRQLSSKLLEYMAAKYEGDEAMPCGSCSGGKKRSNSPPPPMMMARTLNEGVVTKMADDLVWVTLNDGNIGSHRIVFEREEYGYRSHGERFKMRRAHALKDGRVLIDDDAQVAQPQVQVQVQVAELEPLNQSSSSSLIVPPPAPKPLPDDMLDNEDDSEDDGAEEDDDDDFSDPRGPWGASPIQEATTAEESPKAEENLVKPKPIFDFTQIWGIAQERNDILVKRGVRSLDGLIALGVTGIIRAFEVPEKTAQRILLSAESMREKNRP